MSENRSYGWKNVTYESYKDLPKGVGNYNNEAWVEKQLSRIQNIGNELEQLKERNKLLIDYLNKQEQKEITILDYGGGLGLSYISLVSSTRKKLNYHISELPFVCDAGRKQFPKSIHFHEDIPRISKLDILYIRTSLQYAEDWKKDLKNLLDNNPKNIIFSHLSSGNIPTFLTLQIWGDYLIHYSYYSSLSFSKSACSKQPEQTPVGNPTSSPFIVNL